MRDCNVTTACDDIAQLSWYPPWHVGQIVLRRKTPVIHWLPLLTTDHVSAPPFPSSLSSLSLPVLLACLYWQSSIKYQLSSEYEKCLPGVHVLQHLFQTTLNENRNYNSLMYFAGIPPPWYRDKCSTDISWRKFLSYACSPFAKNSVQCLQVRYELAKSPLQRLYESMTINVQIVRNRTFSQCAFYVGMPNAYVS